MAGMYREPELTDREMLDALCKTDDERMPDDEREAFQGMKRQRASLTPKQRQWAEGEYRRLELDAQKVRNLVSSGVVQGTVDVHAMLEAAGIPQHMRHPLKPPTRPARVP